MILLCPKIVNSNVVKLDVLGAMFKLATYTIFTKKTQYIYNEYNKKTYFLRFELVACLYI